MTAWITRWVSSSSSTSLTFVFKASDIYLSVYLFSLSLLRAVWSSFPQLHQISSSSIIIICFYISWYNCLLQLQSFMAAWCFQEKLFSVEQWNLSSGGKSCSSWCSGHSGARPSKKNGEKMSVMKWIRGALSLFQTCGFNSVPTSVCCQQVGHASVIFR